MLWLQHGVGGFYPFCCTQIAGGKGLPVIGDGKAEVVIFGA